MSDSPSLPSFRAFPRPNFTKADDLEDWARDFRLHEKPEGPIEEALIDRIIRTAWRLRLADPKSDSPPTDRDSLRILTEAERAWTRVLTDWARYRKSCKSVKTPSRPADKPAPKSNDPQPEPSPDPYTPPSTPVSWPQHVAIDPSVSQDYPIVKGTNLFVDLVASMLQEGLTPEEIHRDFPSLNGTQIEAARLCDVAGFAGPWPSRTRSPQAPNPDSSPPDSTPPPSTPPLSALT